MQGEATSLEKTPGICMQIFMAASFIITIFKKEIPFLIYKLRENGILLSNKWNELLITKSDPKIVDSYFLINVIKNRKIIHMA